MRVLINGQPLDSSVQETSSSVTDVIFQPWGIFGEAAFEALKDWLRETSAALVHLLDVYMDEIVGVAVIFCGFGMMFAPLLGSTAGKWFGRAVFITWCGIVWRILV